EVDPHVRRKIDWLPILTSWFKPDLLRGSLRVLIQSVAQALYYAHHLDFPRSLENNLQQHIALNLQLPSFCCVLRFWFEQNYRPFLMRHRIGSLLHVRPIRRSIVGKYSLLHFAAVPNAACDRRAVAESRARNYALNAFRAAGSVSFSGSYGHVKSAGLHGSLRPLQIRYRRTPQRRRRLVRHRARKHVYLWRFRQVFANHRLRHNRL